MNCRPADLVLRGGAVYQVDAARSRAQAVAVRDGLIAAVGTDAQVDALTGFTIGSAYVNHADHLSGSIEARKAADLVVLDRNLFARPVEEIALARVEKTFAAGQLVHETGA